MLVFYGYILIVFIIFVLMIEALYISKFSPNKVKAAAIIVIMTMLLRDISLIILSLAHNIKHLYLLKPIFFLNFISIPLLALIALYIFIRRDNINFSYIFIIAAILVGLYGIMIFKCPTLVQANEIYGYTMILTKDLYLYWSYVTLNTIILFLTIALSKNRNINKLGISMIIFAALITIIEIILWIIGIKILPENVIGDMLWSATIVYALSKVRKK
ncbi:hypothetical protein [Clostridium sp. OS1-26]|uniref:hypothetical protein n=1 Tax=Clostridium sp. OS1-26 TaxID=3070681 RepID=UPI0027E1B060|nr:hypothetical protein [Clostridium sp. OS1-26]WML36656.1 hypothetical protein RCG18_08520 [Clostridium sp. OS1-26]